MFNIILAIDEKFGIGKSSSKLLPWNIKEDLDHFKKITSKHNNSYIIMGRKTADTFKSPLPNRKNIVITSKKDYRKEEGFISFTNIIDIIKYFMFKMNEYEAFIIGGSGIIEEIIKFPKFIKTIYLTKIKKDFECDITVNKLENLLINYYESNINNQKLIDKNTDDKLDIVFSEYKKRQEIIHPENNYLSILENLLYSNMRMTRNGNTLSKFGKQIQFNLKEGFPILTTKRVYWRGVVEELLFFLSGSTDNKLLKEKKVNIWNANTTSEFISKLGLNYKEDTLGPMYGFQWRYFNAEYNGCDKDYTGKGTDQFKEVIDTILNDPFSRRILLTTYNVNQAKQGVLYPCHGLVIQFYVNTDYSIDCQMYQRSCDWFLGVPFNISSYALLMHIVVNIVNNKSDKIKYSVGNLIMVFGDYHLYEQHIEAAITQISRYPKQFPELLIKKNITEIDPKYFLSELKYEDFELTNYKCCPKISAQMVA